MNKLFRMKKCGDKYLCGGLSLVVFNLSFLQAVASCQPSCNFSSWTISEAVTKDSMLYRCNNILCASEMPILFWSRFWSSAASAGNTLPDIRLFTRWRMRSFSIGSVYCSVESKTNASFYWAWFSTAFKKTTTKNCPLSLQCCCSFKTVESIEQFIQ